MATLDLNLVVLPYRDMFNVVFLAELLAQRSCHDLAADVTGSVEVRLPVLSTGNRDETISLHSEKRWCSTDSLRFSSIDDAGFPNKQLNQFSTYRVDKKSSTTTR